MTAVKEISVARAAREWESCKRELDRLKPILERAADRLKAHFRDTGDQDYKGRIGYGKSSRNQVDMDKVRQHLGERLADFQRRVEYETLSLLAPD